MNIKNRLEILENAAGVNSENCTCQREIITRVILPDLDRTDDETERLTEEAQRPETCNQCQKVIEKQLIVIRPHNSLRTETRKTKPGETFATFNIQTKTSE